MGSASGGGRDQRYRRQDDAVVEAARRTPARRATRKPYGRTLLNSAARTVPAAGPLGARLPPSSGGIGIMLNTASSTIQWIGAAAGARAIGAEMFGSANRDRGRSAAPPAAARRRRPAPGCWPAQRRPPTCSRARGCARGAAAVTGTGFAQPMQRRTAEHGTSGSSTVPMRSAWTIGFSDTRPSSRAVGSPRPISSPRVRHLVHGQ